MSNLSNGSVKFWDTKASSKKPVFLINSENPIGKVDLLFPNLLTYSYDNSSGFIDYIDLRKQKSILNYQVLNSITEMKFLPNQKGFVTGYESGFINITNFTKKSKSLRFEINRNNFAEKVSAISSISFLKEFLFFSTQQGVLNIMDLNTNLLVYQKFLGLPIVSGDVSCRNEYYGYSLSNGFENSVKFLKQDFIYQSRLSDFSILNSDEVYSWEKAFINENNKFFEKKEYYSPMRTKFDDLPTEIIQSIISFLDINNFTRLSLVNHHFYNSIKELHTLNVPFQIKNIFRFNSLEKVSFSPYCYKYLGNSIQNLTIIAHPREEITIENYKNLKILSIKNCKFLNLKNKFENLEEIYLENCSFFHPSYLLGDSKNKGVKIYENDLFFPNLKKASLIKIEIQTTYIDVILSMPLIYCDISYSGFHLGDRSKLEEYHCQGSLYSKDSVSELENIIQESKNLKILNASFNTILQEFKVQSPSLLSLNLTGCSNLKTLKLECINLKILYIGGTNLTEKDISTLKLQIPSLIIHTKF